MSETRCKVCDQKIVFIKTKIADGFICGGCLDKLPLRVYKDRENYTGDMLKALIAEFDSKEVYRGKSLFDRREKKSSELRTENDRIEAVKKYKELLDQGIITQEEFDKKKKEILGL